MSDLASLSAKLDSVLEKLSASEDKRLTAFTGLMRAVENSLAEAVELLEKGGSVDAIKALADAIRAMPAPQVNVQAMPAPAAAPVVHVIQQQGEAVFKISLQREKGNGYGVPPVESITITKLTAKP